MDASVNVLLFEMGGDWIWIYYFFLFIKQYTVMIDNRENT